MNSKDILIPGVNDDWLICFHCSRAYQVKDIRVIAEEEENIPFEDEPLILCGYPDCFTSAEYESWSWNEAREINPDLPETPERNRVYHVWW